MKKFLTLLALLALTALSAPATHAQSYPPELSGGQFEADEIGVIATLDHFYAPISLPPSMCIIQQGTISSDGQTVELVFNRLWDCDWNHTSEQSFERTLEWNESMGAYLWWAPINTTCFNALVYHSEEDIEFVQGCFVFTGHCCPWFDFGSTGYFWIVDAAPKYMMGYVPDAGARR